MQMTSKSGHVGLHVWVHTHTDTHTLHSHFTLHHVNPIQCSLLHLLQGVVGEVQTTQALCGSEHACAKHPQAVAVDVPGRQRLGMDLIGAGFRGGRRWTHHNTI